MSTNAMIKIAKWTQMNRETLHQEVYRELKKSGIESRT